MHWPGIGTPLSANYRRRLQPIRAIGGDMMKIHCELRT